MHIYFLGTGAGIPSKRRNVTSICLRLEPKLGQIWMFDCGEGTQHRVLESPIRLAKLTRVFITHLHGDHLYGLPGLLSSRSFQAPDRPLCLYGPPGLERYLEVSLKSSGTHLTYPLQVVELKNGQTLTVDGFTIHVQPLQHGLPCFGYRIEEPPRPGRLRHDKLEALNIPPGPVYKELKQGKTVTLPDGRAINGKEFVDPPIPGRVVALLGDTSPCSQADELAAHADVLIHEATYDARDAALAHMHQHSTNLDAAKLAKRARVKRLILTHLSSRYDERAEQRLLEDARAIFPATELASDLSEFAVEFTH
ncbi:MAG: ribonuclease Z [Alicyclobacillus herbarius]|uniref:ribonuclease Z n=1 Tax=Alicyclobacillus herbarius TaxID=122960 RepID=UPI0023577395|nr:ribonuclease Z [Alicyclobacillus herbarius]MCL6632389.1 ribonuclease Z [Alicyclobacillus herbarius]